MDNNIPTAPKTPEEVRAEYVKRSTQYRTGLFKTNTINNLSAREREAVKLLAQIDDMTGGQLMRLVQAYQVIKNS